MTALLEARGAGVVFGHGARAKAALSDFSVTIEEGAPGFTAIAGESGSGKTTAARLLLGMTRPSSGSVLYRGREIGSLSREQRRHFRRDVQAIFQDPFSVFNPFYRVDHLLHAPLRAFGLAGSRSEERQMIDRALVRVGLRPEDVLGRFPHQFSGGQRQRITIARALLLRPKIIVADEPVSMVDASLRSMIVDCLHKLHEDLGISFLYITHDLATAYRVSRDMMVLYQGRVMESGDAGAVVGTPLHPYTRDLLQAIPQPKPGRTWIEAAPVEECASIPPGAGATRCPYAERCRRVMDRCWRERPPAYDTGGGRRVACFLSEPAAAGSSGGKG